MIYWHWTDEISFAFPAAPEPDPGPGRLWPHSLYAHAADDSDPAAHRHAAPHSHARATYGHASATHGYTAAIYSLTSAANGHCSASSPGLEPGA